MILADCRDALSKIPSDSVDLVLTDPQYNTGLKASNATRLTHFFDEHASVLGNLVLDPFAGIGTTCVIAKKLGRRFLGIEREPRYHARAVAELARTPDEGPARCGRTWRETPCEAVHRPRSQARCASRNARRARR
jgi:DNA modification methylase